MSRPALLLAILTVLVVVPALGHAFVDAVYWIKDSDGNLIYMRDDQGNIIYGNILVGQRVVFDASKSQSYYGKVDRYWWDFDSDGTYDAKKSLPVMYHTFDRAGTYTVKLLAVDSSGPPGSADTYVKEVRVVEKLENPAALFFCQVTSASPSAVNVTLNASASRDPDGYIKYYRWDLDDDGTYDQEMFRRPLLNHTFDRNGYHLLTLSVEDWDGLKDGMQRILKVDGIGGQSVEQKMVNVTVVNKREVPVNVTIVVNNWDTVTARVVNTTTVAVPLNPEGKNDFYLTTSDGGEGWFITGDHTPEFKLLPDKIELVKSGGLPGFGLAAAVTALLAAIALGARRTIKI
ncbi:MAG: PKD domain-containing protein [Candidatus Thermoplasmatota archaeon]|nr:PKD domain-containing protein [Candidatus Thermoplasmatota archaeon]